MKTASSWTMTVVWKGLLSPERRYLGSLREGFFARGIVNVLGTSQGQRPWYSLLGCGVVLMLERTSVELGTIVHQYNLSLNDSCELDEPQSYSSTHFSQYDVYILLLLMASPRHGGMFKRTR